MVNPETPIWQLTVKEFMDLIESLKPKPVKENEDEVYMTSKEVIDYLNVSKSTVVRWRKSLYLPYIKRGGVILHKKSEIDKVLNQ